MYPCLKKYMPLLFLKLQQTWTNFYNFFTVKFRKDLQKKKELELSPPLKSVAKHKGQLYSFPLLLA